MCILLNNKSELSAHSSLIMYIFLRKSLRTPAGAYFLGFITFDRVRIYSFKVAGGKRCVGVGRLLMFSPAIKMSPWGK